MRQRLRQRSIGPAGLTLAHQLQVPEHPSDWAVLQSQAKATIWYRPRQAALSGKSGAAASHDCRGGSELQRRVLDLARPVAQDRESVVRDNTAHLRRSSSKKASENPLANRPWYCERREQRRHDGQPEGGALQS